MHNSSLICSDRKHGSEMRTPSTAPRSPFPGWGRCRACEAEGVHGLGGGMWPDEGLTDGRECAIIKGTKCGVIHAVASL